MSFFVDVVVQMLKWVKEQTTQQSRAIEELNKISYT